MSGITNSLRDKEYRFDTQQDSIPDKQIKETKFVEVVIIGAGIAGLTAAVSAAEAGARTILLEKGDTFHVRGLHNAALNSRLQKEVGIRVDKERVIATIMEFGQYRGDQRLVKLWADHCDETMDWLLDMAKEAKVEVVLDLTTKDWYFPNYPLIHVFIPDRQNTLAQMLLEKGRSLGVEYRFEMPAVRLLREANGRVAGVIARDRDGNYLKYMAEKGIVLCTGDYGNDREMLLRYCNWLPEDLKVEYDPPVNTGDGHKMALQVGAAIDEIPHCPMLFDFATFNKQGIFNLARQPWLYVNARGERFMNEDLPWGYECNQILRQPGRFAWSIWDAKYPEEVPLMRSQCCKNMGPPTYLCSQSQLDHAVEKGYVLVAQSIEELAEKMGIQVESFKATVVRYNELARSGKDRDFGKHPDRLTTIEKPPFYACKMEVRLMVVLSGLKVNTRLKVLDTDGLPIPGLYAAGNVSGSFFGGGAYSTTTPGVTHSRAWTFGRLAGRNAAAEKQ